MNLKDRRLELGLTLEEVGELVGVGKSTVRKWENGDIDNMRRDKIASLAKALQISPLLLIYPDRVIAEPVVDIVELYNKLEPPRKVKVYNYASHQLSEQNNTVHFGGLKTIVTNRRTAAGSALQVEDADARKEVVSSALIPKGADELVEVVGKSMEPLIMDGEEVYMRYQPSVENGEIAIVRIENEGVTCKRVYANNGTITLRSENEEYEDMHFDSGQISVLGKVLL